MTTIECDEGIIKEISGEIVDNTSSSRKISQVERT
jgi:hypothetical protein